MTAPDPYLCFSCQADNTEKVTAACKESVVPRITQWSATSRRAVELTEAQEDWVHIECWKCGNANKFLCPNC